MRERGDSVSFSYHIDNKYRHDCQNMKETAEHRCSTDWSIKEECWGAGLDNKTYLDAAQKHVAKLDLNGRHCSGANGGPIPDSLLKFGNWRRRVLVRKDARLVNRGAFVGVHLRQWRGQCCRRRVRRRQRNLLWLLLFRGRRREPWEEVGLFMGLSELQIG